MIDSDTEDILRDALEALVPSAFLQWQTIPGTGLEGFLLNEHSASKPLAAQIAERVMQAPPFWGLLWPAGYLLCRLLHSAPELVRDRDCVDLGCGSGLLAVAAAGGGARVVAADSDPLSRQVTELHFERHHLVGSVIARWSENTQTLFMADFLYDESNLHYLQDLRARAEEIVIVDCRLEKLELEEFKFLGRREESAFPDLDPHREFGSVRIWYKGSRACSWATALEGLESPFEG